MLLGLSTLSLSNDSFQFTASLPYMRISGRGLLVFDASGNPIVINRRANGPTDVRTGWGDLSLSASYTIPPAVLADFQVRVTGITKLPTAPSRRRLNTGEADFGMSVDVSRSFGDWTPFVTVGYLNRGQPAGFTFYDTSSVSVGTSYVLNENLVAVASYDYDSPDAPQVTGAHELSASLSWIRDNNMTLTGYGTVGLSSGSPDMGVGFLISVWLELSRPDQASPGFQLLAGVDQALDRVGGLGQPALFAVGQLQLHHPLHAFLADHHRQADIEILDAIGAVDMDGAGQHALLVLEIAFRHRDGAEVAGA